MWTIIIGGDTKGRNQKRLKEFKQPLVVSMITKLFLYYKKIDQSFDMKRFPSKHERLEVLQL